MPTLITSDDEYSSAEERWLVGFRVRVETYITTQVYRQLHLYLQIASAIFVVAFAVSCSVHEDRLTQKA